MAVLFSFIPCLDEKLCPYVCMYVRTRLIQCTMASRVYILFLFYSNSRSHFVISVLACKILSRWREVKEGTRLSFLPIYLPTYASESTTTKRLDVKLAASIVLKVLFKAWLSYLPDALESMSVTYLPR